MDTKFGRQIRNEEFMIGKDVVPINHGSWGTCPKNVFNARTRMLTEVEEAVDDFFRFKHVDLWLDNLKVVSEFVGAKSENMVFLENATHAFSSVMASLDLKPGDGILINFSTYGSVHNICKFWSKKLDLDIVVVPVMAPITSEEQVIDLYRQKVEQNPHIKIAVIDYISSPTATKFPVKALIDLCRQHDVISFIDGAHAPGQIDLNLEELGADFFTGNLHKWVYAARGCAFMWAAPRFHSRLYSSRCSSCYEAQDFRMHFCRQGTRDDTPYYIAKDAIAFYKNLGGLTAITGYTGNLLREAVRHLCSTWGTKPMDIPSTMEAPNMRLVELPTLPNYPVAQIDGFGDLSELIKVLCERFNIYTVCLNVFGKGWIRISAQVYNTIEDYKSLGDAINILRNEDSKN